MYQIFVIGGMGAGKSTARKALVDQGLSYIDLDQVGHEILTWDVVKEDLTETFGADVLDESGEVIRPALAQKAFASPALTRKLNRITLPRIEDEFMRRLGELEVAGCPAVVVENSVYKSRNLSMADSADVVIAILAPLEMRIERAVAAGWSELDVRRRIARQITDAERIEEADVVFNNDSTPEALHDRVVAWWNEFKLSEGI